MTILFPDESTFPGADVFPGQIVFPDGPRIWLFSPPTRDVYTRIAGRGLFAVQPHGLSVWRSGGVWHTGFAPSIEELNAADRYYQGGYVHELTIAQRDELAAAGFADHITSESI